jgi:hypothetical protein
MQSICIRAAAAGPENPVNGTGKKNSQQRTPWSSRLCVGRRGMTNRFCHLYIGLESFSLVRNVTFVSLGQRSPDNDEG